jgi:hypothetical protein
MWRSTARRGGSGVIGPGGAVRQPQGHTGALQGRREGFRPADDVKRVDMCSFGKGTNGSYKGIRGFVYNELQYNHFSLLSQGGYIGVLL